MLIGNLTRDPELRYTPSGVAVCSFGVATNRRWTTQDGEKKDEAQFHRVVAWSQLAEICSQLLTKGAKVYVEGRLQYREWTGTDNLKRQTTEIVISDMVLLEINRSSSTTGQPIAAAGDDGVSDQMDDEGVGDQIEGTAEEKVDEGGAENAEVETGVDDNEVKKDGAGKKESSDIPF